MSDRAASRLLLAVLAERWDEAEARAPSVDPTAFASVCRAADVAPTVHALLSRAGRLALAGPAAADLERARHKARMDNALLLARLEEALDLLARRAVKPVALKGVDVLERLYGSFDERVLDDIDLLVRREERDAAIAALEEAGWRGPAEPERTHWFGSSYQLPIRSPGAVSVLLEVHWSLGQEMRYRIDDEAIRARAMPLTVAGRDILRLDEHDAVAHLLLHHVQHYFDRRLKWVLELVRRAGRSGFSWPIVAERLERWGGRGAAGLALAHVHKLFPAAIDEEAFRLLPADAWRLAVTSPLRSSHPLDFYRGTRRRAVQLWIAAAALERPSDLPAYLRHRGVRDSRPTSD